MADKAGDVFATARWLAGDPNGDYTSEAFMVPPMNIVQREIISELLDNPNVSRLKFAVIIPNVPAGTTDLRPWFDGTKSPSLATLKEIVSVREKPAGAPEQQFQDMEKVNDMPVRQQVGFNSDYVWTGDTILLPGATQALDLRVWGVFEAKEVADGESPVIPNCRASLEWGLAALVAEGHGTVDKIKRLNEKYEDAKFNLLNNMMMEAQFEETRQRPYGELSGTLD